MVNMDTTTEVAGKGYDSTFGAGLAVGENDGETMAVVIVLSMTKIMPRRAF